MKHSLSRIIAVMVGILLLATNLQASLAHNEPPAEALPAPPSDMEQELSSALKSKIKRGSSFLFDIESQIKSSQGELELLRNNKSQLKSKIEQTKGNVRSLQSQLDNLAQLIQSNRDRVAAVSLLIAQYENQTDVLKTSIKDAQGVVDVQVQSLDGALSAYYLHTNAYFSDSDPKLLALLSYGDTTGDILKENEYLFALQDATQDLAKNIISTQTILDEKKNILEDKTQTLNELKDLLSSQERNIISADESRKRLLKETQGKQLIYETLLQLSEKEASQVSVQITKLKENFTFFQSKLDELKKDPLSKGISFDSLSLNVSDGFSTTSTGSPLAWPVSPSLGLSALFHDESYKKAMGVVHNAIDIRIGQGSQVRAAADGVVTKVIDNGLAYSYIIIAHPGNLLTLYGHMSDSFVTEGEVVKAGEVIGLSGGMPGTKGAGWLTTGPHLHFEVFKDWKHVDPLEFLPLQFVPVASLPDKYLKKIIGEADAKKVKRPE